MIREELNSAPGTQNRSRSRNGTKKGSAIRNTINCTVRNQVLWQSSVLWYHKSSLITNSYLPRVVDTAAAKHKAIHAHPQVLAISLINIKAKTTREVFLSQTLSRPWISLLAISLVNRKQRRLERYFQTKHEAIYAHPQMLAISLVNGKQRQLKSISKAYIRPSMLIPRCWPSVW